MHESSVGSLVLALTRPQPQYPENRRQNQQRSKETNDEIIGEDECPDSWVEKAGCGVGSDPNPDTEQPKIKDIIVHILHQSSVQ